MRPAAGGALTVITPVVVIVDRAGQYSIRINSQWRLGFAWIDGDAHEFEIVDYH